ncbi:MAG: hypothetical protein ACOZDD_11950 [Bacteroidota bacterium]
MDNFFYLVATPESLLASHLPPFEFGNYLAVGTKKQTRGQVIFFEVDSSLVPGLPWNHIHRKLVPYENGQPKRSVYLSIYRALESVPLEALKSLYLVSDEGLVLEIPEGKYESGDSPETHLYQQFVPGTTRVASKLSPPEFVKFLTDTSHPVSAPKVFFAELLLNELASNPYAPLNNLPYANPDHLRDCLIKLTESKERTTKTVLRSMRRELAYRTIRDGFFIGEQERMKFYPFPSVERLENEYFSWWRSALIPHF